jgi:hypothetical protein
MGAATNLLTAEYSVNTKYGISSETYTSTADNPIHGPGQGSRMAPALWLTICCLLFEAMSKMCTGTGFCNPRNTKLHQQTGDGFVDDVTNFFNFGLANMLNNGFDFRELAEGLQTEAHTASMLASTFPQR